jgi:hypothetical protein
MSTVGGGVNIVVDGLVLYLDAANPKSYVSGSTTWVDVSRSGTNGTLVSGSTFNNGNGGNISITNSATGSITGTTTFTTSFSVEISFMPLTLTNYAPVFSIGLNNGSGGWGDFVLHTTSTGEIYCGTDVTNRFNPTNNGCGAGAFVVNRIYNVVFTFNAGVGIIYKNSVLLATKAMNTPLNPSITAPYVLSNINGIIGGMRVYTFKVYNRALTQAEIIQNYNATRTRFNL